MAQYSYDFSSKPVGSGPPAGWTEIGTSGKVSVADHAVYGRGLRVTNLNTAPFDMACIWTDLGTVSRPLEVVARYLAVNNETTLGGLLALADTTNWNAYVAALIPRDINQTFQFSRCDAGARTNLWTNNNPPVVPDTPYWARIRFNTDGTINLKYWKGGDPEPSTWMHTLTDAMYSSGYVGVEIQRFNTYYYFWIGVGTNGDSAPTSAGGGQTISESIGLGIAAGVSPSATASAIDAVSLSKAFGAFLTAKAIVQESISVATSTDILDSSSATANETLTLGIALSLIAHETAGFLVTESIVLGMAARIGAEATATAKATLVLSESLGLSLSEKATATDAVLLAARAAIAASSRATVTGILTIASSYALNAYYGNIISEAIGLAHRAGLNVSAAATARADVTIALAASLVNAARALAEAGVGVGSVIDITISESAVTVRVELPSGRTLYVRADPRTYCIRKQDRTDRVK